MRISEALDLDFNKPNIIAVVGCGGKTAIINSLAKRFRDKRVLISPTTKIVPPNIEGVDCLGRLDSETGKLEAVSKEDLYKAVMRYDLVLLEADGSRGLPCKGWLDDEPQVPGYCSHTVGIITLSALNKPSDNAVVHRLPAFLALTGLREGDKIDKNALKAMVLSSRGMFKNSAGMRILIINQVEDEQTEGLAASFLSGIKAESRDMFRRLLYGSARLDRWVEV